jgi:hypothetical protein
LMSASASWVGLSLLSNACSGPRLPSGLWSGLRAALAQRLVKPAAAR